MTSLPSAPTCQYNRSSMTDTVRKTSTSVRSGALFLALVFAGSLLLAFQIPEARAQRKKVVFGEDAAGSEVIGYVHKPEVGYVITRQEQEDLETLQLKESFLPKIVKSVEKKPF